MSKRIYVVWTNPIFRDSVGLILDHPDIHWVGKTSDYGLAKESISRLKPDVILVEEVESSIRSPFLAFLEASSFDAQLIIINLNDNTLKIYHRQEWNLVREEDLLKLVLN